MIAAFISCRESAEEGFYETPEEKKTRKYHTEEHQGLWLGLADTHLPVVRFTSPDRRSIEVTVPLKGTKKPFHYIEKIALLKNEKVIDSRTIKFSFSPPEVKFVIPDTADGSYSVVARCNLHGMWRVDLEDIPSEDALSGE